MQMMKNICIQEGDLVWVENVTLPLATFAKFQPQTVDFLDITDPKAVYPLLFLIILYIVARGLLTTLQCLKYNNVILVCCGFPLPVQNS